MKLELKSRLWRYIYYNLREEYYKLNHDGYTSRSEIEDFLKKYKIVIKKDSEGRWEEIYIDLNEEELTLFLLRWAV